MASTVIEYGVDDVVVRTYRRKKLDATVPVVCDTCNNTWMSDLSSNAKLVMEGFIRHERPATLLPRGIHDIASFAFMKAAVLDYSAENRRPPIISPATCHGFRRSVQTPIRKSLPPAGLQVWMARYRSQRRMETRFSINGLVITKGAFKGFHLLLITYLVGAFALQVTFPKWTKQSRKPLMPFIHQAPYWDKFSTAIWPGVDDAVWPPPQPLTAETFEAFRERFKFLTVPFRRR